MRITSVILNVKCQCQTKIKMGSSRSEKAASHERIVSAAAAQIRRDGTDAVRVSELMREAGLTHGAFYRHFGSRDDLIAEAIDAALTDGSRRANPSPDMDPASALLAIIDGYLTQAHRDHPELGCAVAALPADVSRGSTGAREAYGRQVRSYIDRLVGLMPDAESEADREEAMLTLAALVGAVSMARAVYDTELSDEILAWTERALHRRIEERDGSDD